MKTFLSCVSWTTKAENLFGMSFILVFVLFSCPLSSTGAYWTYKGSNGEDHWPSNYPSCGRDFQSPIDFQNRLLRYESSLPPIQLQNYNLSANEQLTLSNNGHSVQLSLPSHMHISSLPHMYSASQLHFHWGSSSHLSGSEHTVNGKRFAGEMHVVHFNSDKYPNISMAVDKHDGLAVLGVFIEIGDFNPAIDKLFKYINGVRYKDQKIQVPSFNIRDLLPDCLEEYYRYDGSLTTPPCFPSVLWTVFRKPVTISHEQFLTLATALYASYHKESVPVALHGNFRKLQLTGSRVVLVSFKETASPFQNKQVQKLLSGADLADEGLYKLLPKLNPQPGAVTKRKSRTQTLSQATGKKPWRGKHVPRRTGHSSVGKNMNPHIGTFDLDKDLCFVSLENDVQQLERYHAKGMMVEALREDVFPKLNLKSYLDCWSDQDLKTNWGLVKGNPGDEAAELEQSLTRAILQQIRHHRKVMSPSRVTVPKGFNLALLFRGPQHSEWED